MGALSFCKEIPAPNPDKPDNNEADAATGTCGRVTTYDAI